MTNSKMTYVDALNAAIAVETLSDEVRNKLTVLRDQTAKRNSADAKPTKTQLANEAIKDAILAALAVVGKPVTISELQEADAALSDMTNQKVSALVRQLVEAGKVRKDIEKRKSYFSVA